MICYDSELPKRNSSEEIIKTSLKRVAQPVKVSFNENFLVRDNKVLRQRLR